MSGAPAPAPNGRLRRVRAGDGPRSYGKRGSAQLGRAVRCWAGRAAYSGGMKLCVCGTRARAASDRRLSRSGRFDGARCLPVCGNRTSPGAEIPSTNRV
jgi:hypothetical protein